jgi:glutathione S-transferase
MLTLYHDHNAVCCQKVELALYEKNVSYENRTISLFRSEQYSPEYLKINPRGIVPSLVHDDTILVESTIICEYINEVFGGLNLMSVNAVGRAETRVWTKLVDDEIHEAGSTLSFCAMFRDRMLAMDIEEQEKRYRNVGNPTREEMYRSSVEFGIDSPVAFRAIASYELMTRDLEFCLSDGKKWISGDGFSLAEIGLTPYFARVEFLGLLDIWIGKRPKVREWWERVKSRESFVQVILGQLTEYEISEMENSGKVIYDRVEQRRDEYLEANLK